MGRRRTNVTHEATDAKPLRRDAELNLARILLAARDVFGEYGYDASMEQIAARAEVGIGTLYRRFPNKADLCAAVVDAATDRTLRNCRRSPLGGGPERRGLRVHPALRGRAEQLAGCYLAATLERRRRRPSAGRCRAAHRADPRSRQTGRYGPAGYRPHRFGRDPDVGTGHWRPLRRRRPGHLTAVPRVCTRRPAARTQNYGVPPDVGQAARTCAHRPLSSASVLPEVHEAHPSLYCRSLGRPQRSPSEREMLSAPMAVVSNRKAELA